VFRLVSLSSGALRSFIQYQLQGVSVFLQRGPAVSSWSCGDTPWTYFSMFSMLHLLLWTRCVSSLWQSQNLYFLAASFKNLQPVLLTAFSSSEEQGKNMQLPGEELQVFDFFSLTASRAKNSMAAQDCHFHGGQT
jgi:hypothetical protein